MLQPLVAAALLFGQAGASPPDCITRQEATDMTVAFLPHLVDAVSRRCRSHLQSDAFLVSRSEEWIEQLRREAAPRRESALRGFAKFGGGDMPAPPEGAGAEVTFEFMASMATGAIIQAIAPESCDDMDILTESLRPLPPENVGRIVAATLSLAQMRQDQDDEESTAGEAASGDRDPAAPVRPAICPT